MTDLKGANYEQSSIVVFLSGETLGVIILLLLPSWCPSAIQHFPSLLYLRRLQAKTAAICPLRRVNGLVGQLVALARLEQS